MANFRCCQPQFDKINRNQNDGVTTASSEEQESVEKSVERLFQQFRKRADQLEPIDKDIESVDDDKDNPTPRSLPKIPVLEKNLHTSFLMRGLRELSTSYQCLDASRPWLCYWILHSLELLDVPIDNELTSQVANFIAKCQCSTGGFAGGPGQQAHLAPTYAAVNALCILGTEEAFKVINREKLQAFLFRMRSSYGSFLMHEGGEEDIRGAYCAASVARLTNSMCPELFDGTAEWIARCQSYEGGFAGCPGVEAHGGYSFCGIAALTLLNRTKLCDIKGLLRWTAFRQMKYEGGFQGRTNKLVDGCYSFWQGGAFPLIHMVLATQDDEALSAERWMFDHEALQEYLLICCQYPSGGLVDKPGKVRDFYHTCYCLSGLAVAQHFAGGKLSHQYNVGNPLNELQSNHPVYNVCVSKVIHADLYFKTLPVPKTYNSPDKP